MHTEARLWVVEKVAELGPFENVVEIGSLDVNGSIRELFGGASYVGLDLLSGPGVDWVGDAADYEPGGRVDCVVCCEVLEHTPDWQRLVTRAMEWLGWGGVLIITCAGPGRRPHSADGTEPPREGEHYENVSADQLGRVLGARAGYLEVRMLRWDTQAAAIVDGQ